MSENNKQALWPNNSEVFYHLDYVPFIDLNINFDSSLMLAEARALLSEFVLHRENTQVTGLEQGAWKSLALRSHEGDPLKTEYHTSYTKEKIGNYKNTPIMDKCPETYKFLSTITDVDSCDRIRFMLLEPGAEIKAHRDSEIRDVSLAINISLNMPENCVFWSNLNSNGSQNNFSKKIPFKNNGSVFLFNNAKFHSLKNNSSEARIHLIFHGPIKIDDKRLLQLARAQNNISTAKELLTRLMQKKCLSNESLEKTLYLQKDWIMQGLLPNSLGEDVKIIVLKHSQTKGNQTLEVALEKMTIPSLFPLDFEAIDRDMLDEYLLSLSGSKYSKILICTAGLLIHNIHSFILENLKLFGFMDSSNTIAAGHLMDDPKVALPYFHQQFLILDLPKWEAINRPLLGAFFSSGESTFSNYSRGKDLHDHYTPAYLAQGNEVNSRVGRIFWGTEFIQKALQSNFQVVNIPPSLREAKMYSYPLDNDIGKFQKIELMIQNLGKQAAQNVYFFNNEDLRIPLLSTLNPTTLISVASGLKPFKILEDYQFPKNSKIVFIDFSSNALNYIKSITSSTGLDNLVLRIEKFVKVISPHLFSNSLIQKKCTELLTDFFDQNVDILMKRLHQGSRASFVNLNIIENPEGLISFIEPNERFIIWVSNVFYNTHAYHIYGVETSHDHYINLAINISKKINTKAFCETNTNNIIFGSDIRNPLGFLTDGSTLNVSNHLSDWHEIY